MRHHMAFKFFAVLLSAFFLLVAVSSGFCVVVLLQQGLYSSSLEEVQEQNKRKDLNIMADSIATSYAAGNLSNCPKDLIEHYTADTFSFRITEEGLSYFTIKDENGHILSSNYPETGLPEAQTYEFLIRPEYPVVLDYSTVDGSGFIKDDFFPSIIFPDGNNPGQNPNDPTDESMPDNYLYSFSYRWYDETGDMTHIYRLASYRGPMYLVTLHLRPGAYELQASLEWELMDLGQQYRYVLLFALCTSLLLFSMGFVYLCCTAGKKPGVKELRPGGLNLLPLDLYLFVAGYGVLWAINFISRNALAFLAEYPLWITTMIFSVPGLIASLLVIGLFFAFAAQVKMPRGFWWRHSAILWVLSKLKIFLLYLFKKANRLLCMLPLVWQWVFVVSIVLVAMPISLYFWIVKKIATPAIILLSLSAILLIYCAYSFAVLLSGAKKMSQGNLNTKLSSKWLTGPFARFAEHLNALADVAVVAAKKQMTSERMKAELVTNVSHDIKTPLTSIINYVDLLQKARSPQQTAEYLEVLDRQSQRMKKLIDDLMEMSKASTGNMTVEITKMDAAETVNQALGEFSGKLANAGLTPMFTMPDTPLMINADGRLTWRVMSNLLSNAVKYAMPGTRLYIDITKQDGFVLISLKNISKDPLNVNSDELMERFVRGDVSRNTEGSGLGLNIAKSLMELQKGQLTLLVDGDLFKATLSFPEA